MVIEYNKDNLAQNNRKPVLYKVKQKHINYTLKQLIKNKEISILNYKYLDDTPNNFNEKSWIIHAMGLMGLNPSKRNAVCLKVAKLWNLKI
jgi:hypothetical protein